jgi:hypothetical protein
MVLDRTRTARDHSPMNLLGTPALDTEAEMRSVVLVGGDDLPRFVSGLA